MKKFFSLDIEHYSEIGRGWFNVRVVKLTHNVLDYGPGIVLDERGDDLACLCCIMPDLAKKIVSAAKMMRVDSLLWSSPDSIKEQQFIDKNFMCRWPYPGWGEYFRMEQRFILPKNLKEAMAVARAFEPELTIEEFCFLYT